MSIRQNEQAVKRKRTVRGGILCVAVLILFWPRSGPAYDLYVNSVKASIHLMPDASSETLFEIKQGAKLGGIRKTGYWHQVSHAGRDGWIYGFLVGETPPVKKQEIYGPFASLFQKYETFISRSRRRSSAYSSVAAARGLTENRKRVKARYRLDFVALKKMEAMNVTEDQALNFVREGIQNENPN